MKRFKQFTEANDQEYSDAAKAGMAAFAAKQQRRKEQYHKKRGLDKYGRVKPNTYGYGSYGSKQFAEQDLPDIGKAKIGKRKYGPKDSMMGQYYSGKWRPQSRSRVKIPGVPTGEMPKDFSDYVDKEAYPRHQRSLDKRNWWQKRAPKSLGGKDERKWDPKPTEDEKKADWKLFNKKFPDYNPDNLPTATLKVIKPKTKSNMPVITNQERFRRAKEISAGFDPTLREARGPMSQVNRDLIGIPSQDQLSKWRGGNKPASPSYSVTKTSSRMPDWAKKSRSKEQPDWAKKSRSTEKPDWAKKSQSTEKPAWAKRLKPMEPGLRKIGGVKVDSRPSAYPKADPEDDYDKGKPDYDQALKVNRLMSKQKRRETKDNVAPPIVVRAKPDSKPDIKPSAAVKTKPAVSDPKPPAPDKEQAPQNFGQAFKAARKKAGGPDGTFTWKGKSYSTRQADDPKSSKSSSIKSQKPSARPSAPSVASSSKVPTQTRKPPATKHDVSTKAGRQAWYNERVARARKQGHPNPTMYASQAALETGWGKSKSAKGNLVGMKARKDQRAERKRTREVEGGKEVKTTARFAQFDKEEGGISQHGKEWKGGLTKSGGRRYATDPNYEKKIASITRGYGGAGGPVVASFDPTKRTLKQTFKQHQLKELMDAPTPTAKPIPKARPIPSKRWRPSSVDEPQTENLATFINPAATHWVNRHVHGKEHDHATKSLLRAWGKDRKRKEFGGDRLALTQKIARNYKNVTGRSLVQHVNHKVDKGHLPDHLRLGHKDED